MAGWFARGRTSLVGRLLGTFIRQSRTVAGILVWIGLAVILAILVMGILAPFIAPFDPNTKVGATELPPGGPFEIGEHTSELQSRSDLVCRLLLEKKKINLLI